MANIRKWMTKARELEESGDHESALAVYRKALAAQEETTGFADLGLYNGLGDLHLRAGDVQEAVEAYERAAIRCEEQQLYANGIALCKKILRNAPGRWETHRRVGRLQALSGLDTEARSSFRTYVAAADENGRDDRAVDGLRELVSLTADAEAAAELADLLVDRDAASEALELLRETRDRREAEGLGVVTLVRKIQELRDRVVPGPRRSAVTAEGPARSPAGDEASNAGTPGEPETSDGFDRLHEELARAFRTGDQTAAIDAFLELGQCLDRSFDGFRVKTLSASAETGDVTAAIKVDRPVEQLPGS